MPKPSTAQPLYSEEGKVEKLGKGTRLISLTPRHDGPVNKPIVTPMQHSSTYYADSCKGFYDQTNEGFIYSRIKTANSEELEMVISQIENGKGTVLFPSGMGAIFSTLMCFLKPGDHLVTHLPLYSCSSFILKNMLAQYGIETSYVDESSDVEEFRRATKKNTTVYYGESVGNPMMWYLDVERLAKIAKEMNVLTIVDGTFTSPINQTPLDYGIDIVVHSCTKYMGGHSDMMAGCATMIDEGYYDKLKTWQTFTGSSQSAFDSVLLMRSMRTLHIRMQRHNENGMEVAKFLENHPKVKKVHYLGLPSHPQHALASRTLKGFGGMISFELSNEDDSIKFAEATRIFKLAVSLGGAESLIEHVTSMTHGKWVVGEEEREGIAGSLVRISVGIEDVKDQIADLQQALDKI